MDIQRIREEDNADISAIIKASLEAVGLNIPGTAYTDPQLNDLFHYYQNQDRAAYYIALDNDKVIGGVGFGPVTDSICELQKCYVKASERNQGVVKNYSNMSSMKPNEMVSNTCILNHRIYCKKQFPFTKKMAFVVLTNHYQISKITMQWIFGCLKRFQKVAKGISYFQKYGFLRECLKHFLLLSVIMRRCLCLYYGLI